MDRLRSIDEINVNSTGTEVKPSTCHVPPCHLAATGVLQMTFLDDSVDQALL